MRGVFWEKVKTIQEALSHAPSPVHQQSDLGDGRRWQAHERRASWFSQDSRSQLCQRVVFFAHGRESHGSSHRQA